MYNTKETLYICWMRSVVHNKEKKTFTKQHNFKKTYGHSTSMELLH